jgi:hypothetical protein
MCKEEDIKATEDFLNGKCTLEDYVTRLDPRGASVNGINIIGREVKEIGHGILDMLNRSTLKNDLDKQDET